MEFPNDVVLRITSKLDIDTRRSLKIYSRLKVPDTVKNAITTCLDKVKQHSLGHRYISYIKLGPPRGTDGIHTMYKLCRLHTINDNWYYSVCHAYTNDENNKLHFTSYENKAAADELQTYNISLYYYSTIVPRHTL